MEMSRRQLDKQDWCSKEIITMGVIYLNMHSIKKAVPVMRINEVNMGNTQSWERKEPREEC